MYSVDLKGSEHNIQFAAENEWIVDMGSFYTEKPSKLFIEALEPCHIFQIEQQDLYFLFLNGQAFELKNVTGSVIEFQGEKVLKIERDLNAIPFDEARLEATVDEPTFARLANLDFENVQLFGRFEMTRGTALAKCFEHQTHHRGQTTVYLRLAGVTPPQEKLF